MGALDALLLVGGAVAVLVLLDKKTIQTSEDIQKSITGGTTFSDFLDPIGTGTEEQNPVFQAGKASGDFFFDAGVQQGKLFNFITGNINAGFHQIGLDINNFFKDIIEPSKPGVFA